MKIKPCPHCGGEAAVVKWRKAMAYLPVIDSYQVVCAYCDCRTARHPSKEKAINVWNRRKQLEPQWIPVNERLPEDMQFVLLTVRRLKNEYNPRPFISVGYIGWNHQHWWCAHDGDCEISKVEVIAWMPLPDQYQPEAERKIDGQKTSD